MTYATPELIEKVKLVICCHARSCATDAIETIAPEFLSLETDTLLLQRDQAVHALRQCRLAFRQYADNHWAKKNVEGNVKAMANERLYHLCDDVLKNYERDSVENNSQR